MPEEPSKINAFKRATLVRPSVAVYFIPYVHAEMVQMMEILSKELAAYGITDYESAFESIPLIDADWADEKELKIAQ